MARTINDFRSSFNVDVARPSRFDVNIPIPYFMLTQFNNAKNLTYRCEAAELPGRAFDTVDRRIGTLPVQKFPLKTIYNDMTMTFIVSDDMSEKIFFDMWMEVINPQSTFNMKYKTDYAVDITVNQYDVSGNLTYAATMIDAFPIAINQLDVDWSSTDNHHKLAVVFAYTQWFNNDLTQIGNNLVDQLASGLADDINKALY